MADPAPDAATRALDMAQQFADKLDALAKQYAPEVMQVATGAAQVDAASGLLYGLLLGAAAGFFLVKGVRSWRAGWALDNAYKAAMPAARSDLSDGEDKQIGGAIMLAASMVALVPTGLLLGNLWRWAGVFEPKLWLAKQILGL